MSTMATPPEAPETGTGTEHNWMYWLIGAVVVALMVIGLIVYDTQKDNSEAQAKAQQLTQNLEKAGLRAPEDQDIITSALGTDGGPVCENPASALGKAILIDQLTNGAGFVGRRPVIVDRRAVLGELVILQTYCPDKVQDFQDKIDDLKYDNVIKF
jgi:hypothetical protein